MYILYTKNFFVTLESSLTIWFNVYCIKCSKKLGNNTRAIARCESMSQLGVACQ